MKPEVLLKIKTNLPVTISRRFIRLVDNDSIDDVWVDNSLRNFVVTGWLGVRRQYGV